MIFKHSKRNDENINIKSENDSSKKDVKNDFQHFKNNIFIKSNESEFKSENYADNENDDKKDNDDND